MESTKHTDTSHNTDAAAASGGSLLGHLRASIGVTVILAVICCGVYPLIVWGIAQAVFPGRANGSLIKKDGTSTTDDKEAVGSALIGQNFFSPGYFHARPSAAGSGYDASSSGGSNLGPLSAKLINGTTKATTQPATQPSDPPLPGPDAVDFDGIRDRIVHYCLDNNIAYEPADALKPFMDAQGNVDDVKLIKAFGSDAPPTFLPKEPIPADAVTASGSGLDPHITPRNALLQAARVAAVRSTSLDKVQSLVEEFTERRTFGILGEAGVNVLRLNLALDARYPVPPAPAARPAPSATTPAAPASSPAQNK